MHRRLAELKEQLKDARAEQKADAAAYARTLDAQQVIKHHVFMHLSISTSCNTLLHHLGPFPGPQQVIACAATSCQACRSSLWGAGCSQALSCSRPVSSAEQQACDMA